MVVHLAQLTDLHVVAANTDEMLYVDNNAVACEAVASVVAEVPRIDAVLMTGDLVQWGTAEEYAMLASIVAPIAVPILPLPGNHDDRARLMRCFPEHRWEARPSDSLGAPGHLSWVADVSGVRIVGLDSVIPGQPGAEFDDERAQWLQAALATPFDGPTILAMHHPPFVTGIQWMDQSGFIGLERFEQVIRDAGTVDRIVCGHMHRQISAVVGGVLAEVGPSTTVHVALDLDPDGPVRIVRDPAGYRIFRVSERSIVGHTRPVGTEETAFAPHWADSI